MTLPHFTAAWKAALILGALLTLLLGVQNNTAAQSASPPTVRTAAQIRPLLTDIKSVSVGYGHTCALTTHGSVRCWGGNAHGELGDGTQGTSRITPVYVVALEGIEAITAGGHSTCALTTASGVKCWGLLTGDGTTASHTQPMDVVGLASGAKSVSAGYDHTCALTTGGGVKCWGNNDNGQLGNGNTTASMSPVDVEGLSRDVIAVSAGGRSTCAVMAAGRVMCWGRNDFGQLGGNGTQDSSLPVDVMGLSADVQAVSVGERHACALTAAGALKCWGYNYYGQLGNGATGYSSPPVDVVGLTGGVSAVNAGSGFTCAQTTTGGLKCWGNNTDGQVGDGTIEARLTPVDVRGLDSGVQVASAGDRRACAVTGAGGVKCWGDNSHGFLGDGTISQPHVPTDVLDLSRNVTAIATGSSHTCATLSGGGVKCWGSNIDGQVGDGTTTARPVPVPVLGLDSGVQAISTGYDHTCALTSAGSVKCWGNNEDGQLGDGTREDRNMPIEVVGLDAGVQAISAGGRHTCALTQAGGVKCWGRYDYRTIDTPYPPHAAVNLTPTDVVGLSSGARAIAAGAAHTCALTTEGAVKCWGSNRAGQLGDGTTVQSYTPVNAVGLGGGAQAISANGGRSYALTSGNGAQFWGAIRYGADGSPIRQLIPTRVEDLPADVLAIYPGDVHTCALMPGAALKCWGENHNGQVGDGTTHNRWTPVDVVGLNGPVAAADAGPTHTCALLAAGNLKCWGNNSYGQLGVATWDPKDVAAATPPTQYLPLVEK